MSCYQGVGFYLTPFSITKNNKTMTLKQKIETIKTLQWLSPKYKLSRNIFRLTRKQFKFKSRTRNRYY